MNEDVLIIGPTPPPYGGVSIHVLRLRAALQSRGLSVRTCSFSGLVGNGGRRLFSIPVAVLRAYWALLWTRAAVIHVHYATKAWFFLLSPALLFRRSRRVLTLHSMRLFHDFDDSSAITRSWLRLVLGRFESFICVREELCSLLQERRIFAGTPMVAPAFLPPSPEEADISRLPSAIASRLTAATFPNSMHIAAAAYHLGPGYGQEDLYGIELLARALRLIDANLSSRVVVHVLVSSEPRSRAEKAAEERLLEVVRDCRNVEIMLLFGQPLVPVLARSAAFLRPSREDGDSVAVREALAFGLPVWASDVVVRPEGVALFSLGDDHAVAASLKRFILRAASLRPANRCGPGEGVDLDSFIADLLGKERRVSR